jgi:hypothetical protein
MSDTDDEAVNFKRLAQKMDEVASNVGEMKKVRFLTHFYFSFPLHTRQHPSALFFRALQPHGL